MTAREQALSFHCGDDALFGILSLPVQPAQPAPRGVLIVVGGPQYRAGSHRQFALLARSLAAQGVPVMRFDYRGMGDSEGAPRDFTGADEDMRAALDAFQAAVPGLKEVVLWGLCDAASATLCYAAQDRRVAGLVLLNPWVRTAEGLARATLKHYYRDRLLQGELWRKILRGQFDFGKATRSLLSLASAARRRPVAQDAQGAQGIQDAQNTATPLSLPQRMLAAMQAFTGPVLLILSGKDLTAQEFSEAVSASPGWQRQLAAARVRRHTLDAADHTFSRSIWRDQVASWTLDWVRSW